MPAFLKLLLLLAWSYFSVSIFGVSGGYLVVGSQRLLLYFQLCVRECR